jgi:aryl-alcohol dehydrogenase-like predicted oxidoreductase
MEYRLLGHSGVKVSVLSLGTMTFGGKGSFAKTGSTDVSGARHQIDLCRTTPLSAYTICE